MAGVRRARGAMATAEPLPALTAAGAWDEAWDSLLCWVSREGVADLLG